MKQKLFFTTLFVLLLTSFFLTDLALAAESAPRNPLIQIESVEFSDEPLSPTPIATREKADSLEKRPFTIYRDYESDKPSTFRFSFSDRFIDFGELTPSNPINRSLELLVTNQNTPGYSVFAWEDHPLQQVNGISIPDTTCDNGACSESVAAPWGSGLTYGFGYRCDNLAGQDCMADFTHTGTFKQFSDNQAREEQGLLMQGTRSRDNKKVAVTMQINIPGTQPPGSYTASLNFLAVPGF